MIYLGKIFISIQLCFFISTLALASKESPKEKKNILKIIDEEIKTIKNFGKMTPRLKHRILELQSDKIAIIKEQENKKFIHGIKKFKHPRSFYFSNSISLYQQLIRNGLKIIKTHPRYNGIGEIYLVMALNDQDHGQGKKVERYLLQALRKTYKEQQKYPILVHLAEYYYNKKNYKKAVKIYNSILKNQKDEWISKHYFNAAWCNLKEKNFPRALDMLETAYHLGQENGNQSLQDQVIESFHIFYITTESLDRGVIFLKKNLAAPIAPLFKFVNFAALQGRLKDSIALLKLLKNEIKKKKETKYLAQYYLTAFKTYRQFSHYKNSYNMAKNFYKLDKIKHRSISPEIKEEFKEEIKGLVGFLQSTLVKNVRKNFANYKKEELNRIISFFSILAHIDEKHKKTYYFFQGESYYSVHLYKKSIFAYKKSILSTVPLLPTKEIEKTILNYIGTINLANFDEKKKLEHIEFTYKTYLKIYPKDEKSKKIYKGLFSIFLKSNRPVEAEALLSKYIKNHATDQTNQKSYILSILDFYIDKKNAQKLSDWIYKLRNEPNFNFDNAYILKTEEILAQILFSNYEKMENNRQFKEASMGYEKLSNSNFPSKIRANSALKRAQLLSKIGNIPESFIWLKKAIKTFNKDQNSKNIENYFFLTKRYMLKQNFNTALGSSLFLLNQFYKDKNSNNDELFETIINLSLTLGKDIHVRDHFKEREKYNISQTMEKAMGNLIVDHYLMFRSYNQLFNFYYENKNLVYLYDKYFNVFKTIYWQRYKKQKALSIIKELSLVQKIAKSFTETIDSYKKLESDKKAFMLGQIKIFPDPITKNKKQKFNEDFFNKELEKTIQELKAVNESYLKLSKAGFPEITLRCYLSLEKMYHFLGKSITNLNPGDQPPEFLVPFKKMMKDLGGQLISESIDYKKSAKTLINKYSLFSSINGLVTKSDSISGWDISFPVDRLISPSALTKNMINHEYKLREVK